MNTKKKALNLCAGLGGNRKNWKNVEVTAVELDPKIAKVYQDLYPHDIVVIGDAMEYLKKHRNEFDFVWFSPPCQKHSRMMKATRHDVADFFDPMLWQAIIFLQHFYKGKWIVENVKPYYEPLIKPTAILGRHYFWSNFDISNIDVPSPKGFITSGSSKESVQSMKDWLGIHYDGNIYYKDNHCPAQVLRNCVHPKLGEHVLKCSESKKIISIKSEQQVIEFN